ncbi:hypothetical protein ABPG72_012887 [Tetrahymena utriculariae]
MSLVPEEYQQQYKQNKQELLNLFNLDESWVVLQDKEGVTAHQRRYKDNQVEMIRIETEFNSSLNETADLLFNNAQELLNSKPQLQSAEIIEELNEKGRIILVTTKPILFISPREILVYTNYENIENGIIQVQVGLQTHPQVPLDQTKVRTTTMLGGHILLKNPEDSSKTKVVYIILNLLNGNIPLKLQSTVYLQHLNSYIYFKKLVEKKSLQSQKINYQI